jgi:hypothetical protein
MLKALMRFLVGFGAGVALVALLSPISGETFRANLRAHIAQAREEARKASEARRKELEAELHAMRYGKPEA